MGNKGRPRKFETPEQMQRVIDAYFVQCKIDGKPYTVEGLSNALDIDRKTLWDYEHLDTHADFHHIVKRAKGEIGEDMICNALLGKYNPALSIFIMKNNFGYTDKQEVGISDADSTIKIEIVDSGRNEDK